MSISTPPEGIVAGRNAVREALRSDRTPDKIYLLRGERHGAILPLVSEARSRKIPVEEVGREKMDALCAGVVHQGIAALIPPIRYAQLSDALDLAASRGEKPLLVIADHISDPHNLGALLRSAEGAGAHGLILPKTGACPVNATVLKASAGAALHIPIVRVANLASTCERLKEAGVWICALEADGQDYGDFDYDLPLALILGSEERGVSELLRKKSDFCISLPMCGKVNSLNVSCAGAVVLYTARLLRRK